MLNVTIDYPVLKGEPDVQLASLQSTVCNLIDELKYILPQLDNSIQNIIANNDSVEQETN